jgi:isopropylmalate/homocitrate/citramalate synthase
MSIQISDCTIRDGGYLTGKNFPPEFIHGVIDGLIRAGIDYVETGFLQTQVNGESIVYHDSKDVRKYIPSFKGNTEFVGFCDNSRYSVENLDDCDGESFENLRISFAKHEWREAIKFCAEAKAKGYYVFVQPMDAPGYTDEERKELIFAVNEIEPEAFAIVDTFGAMHLEDLYRIFKNVDQLLDRKIKIGLHSHNNLHLSCALAEQLIMMAEETNRNVAIDGALFGMGRGAGNACTEQLVNFLNTRYGKHYDLPVLLDTIEKYIIPLKQTIYWGYDIPMFICGSESAHVDNIYYLQKNMNCSYRELHEVIHSMDIEERKRYGANYSKGDFTILQNAYKVYKNERK